MAFADKLIQLRKKAGWSQEELAEQINVTRQSVSKWESKQSVPDLEKIVRISELFCVSTDYLLKDDIDECKSNDNFADDKASVTVSATRHVSMEEAKAFLSSKYETSKIIAFATFLCIISPICLIMLGVLSEIPEYKLTDTFACGVGMIVLLTLVAIAVAMYISSGRKSSAYGYLENEIFETDIEVKQMVEECKAIYGKTYTRNNVIGACCCITAVIPLFVGIIMDESDMLLVVAMLSLMFVIAGIGVSFFIRSGIIWASYQKLLQEDDYTKAKKLSKPHASSVASIYWLAITAIFLCYSLSSNDWNRSWLIWAVAGFIFPAVIEVRNLLNKK